MSAGAMSDGDDAREVEAIFGGVGAQQIGGRRCVAEGAGIAATGTIDPAIVDVPHRIPCAAKVVGGPIHDTAVGDTRRPAPAMDAQSGREGAGPGREPELDL